ncbi:hypothetical protein [Pseudoalteromonas distincta]|uniref:hypothetical protein n=1 Tax=Pseudoalteromonas distincta TaxID=77608 RepID=UPI00165F0D53|nr:hypothetical protein [Pseudoalteromonas distincta]MBD0412089.1 hypothetical protein [Pseudoalteromonas distincta]
MTPLKSCELELVRFFNKYYKYCSSSDSDDLKELLGVMCSACEKLERVTPVNFGKNKKYRALKALRNFATHESELLNTSKALSLQSKKEVHAEVQLMCLLPKSVLDYAMRNLKSKQTKKFLNESVVQYGKYFDIYPPLFNFTVDLYFEIKAQQLHIDCESFKSFENSIQYEKRNGFPHYIKGKVVMLDGSDVDVYLEQKTISIESKNEENFAAPIGEDGLYSYLTGYKEMPYKEVATMNEADKLYILNLLLESGVLKIDGENATSTRPLEPVESIIVSDHLKKISVVSNT